MNGAMHEHRVLDVCVGQLTRWVYRLPAGAVPDWRQACGFSQTAAAMLQNW
jgi:hypothetical protein